MYDYEQIGNHVISTNYDVIHLAEKYGERTVDRLKATTKYVSLTGQSLRK